MAPTGHRCIYLNRLAMDFESCVVIAAQSLSGAKLIWCSASCCHPHRRGMSRLKRALAGKRGTQNRQGNGIVRQCNERIDLPAIYSAEGIASPIGHADALEHGRPHAEDLGGSFLRVGLLQGAQRVVGPKHGRHWLHAITLCSLQCIQLFSLI